MNKSYNEVMSRKNEIMRSAVGIEYGKFESGSVAFDYEGLMKAVPYTVDEIAKIQLDHAVGNTPLIELKNLTKLARMCAPKGKGARIVIKDEACNASEVLRRVEQACQFIKRKNSATKASFPQRAETTARR